MRAHRPRAGSHDLARRPEPPGLDRSGGARRRGLPGARHRRFDDRGRGTPQRSTSTRRRGRTVSDRMLGRLRRGLQHRVARHARRRLARAADLGRRRLQRVVAATIIRAAGGRLPVDGPDTGHHRVVRLGACGAAVPADRIGCGATGRRSPARPSVGPHLERTVDARTRVSALALVVASALLISPMWGAVSLVPAAVLVAAVDAMTGPGRLLWSSPGCCARWRLRFRCSGSSRNDRPFPNAGWTLSVDQLNGLAVFAIVSIAVGAMFAPDAASEPS